MAEQQIRSRRFSLVDAGAAAAVLLAAAGVIWSPKLSGAVARATGAMMPVEVTVDIKHVPAADPQALVQQIKNDGRTSLVIRNQPHGSVQVKSVSLLSRQVALRNVKGALVSCHTLPELHQFRPSDAAPRHWTQHLLLG